ncbi:hypothetical protein LSH36_881g03000 [Paralvinella palmiformis]|uniref:Uncharacterized protein n=1 Tax=Paralvinella palmiformis TaxID=53620 RepID=A0AAD9IZ76_9ANNE|nr:hypothetical protein LSH36_881g03000 [Paralvinella palmiformis]
MADEVKTKWPELVGKDGNEAKEIIEKERPDLKQVHIIPINSPVTMDFRQDRVRIVTNQDGTVAVPPCVG